MVPLLLSTLLLTMIGWAGCSRSTKTSAPGPVKAPAVAGQSNWLRISTDPAELARARELARRARKAELERVFGQLAKPAFLDSETSELIDANRAEAVPRFEAALAEKGITDKGVGAALHLIRLRAKSGRSYARRVLESGSNAQRKRVLNGLDANVYGEDAERAHRAFLFGDPAMLPALLACLESADVGVVKAAIQKCGILQVPGARTVFLRLLERPDCPDKGRLLYWLSKGELDDGLFKKGGGADKKSIDQFGDEGFFYLLMC